MAEAYSPLTQHLGLVSVAGRVILHRLDQHHLEFWEAGMILFLPDEDSLLHMSWEVRIRNYGLSYGWMYGLMMSVTLLSTTRNISIFWPI